MKTPQLIDSSQIKDSPIPGFLQPERWLPIIAVFALLAACSTPDPLDKLASEHPLLRGVVQAGDFKLVTLSKPLPTKIPQLRVYIGSDGRPWFKNQPTRDPTGTRSLAAELMLQDPLPALYLGRPCYHINPGNPPCEEALWTSGRYSHTVIEAMTRALQEIVRNHGVKQLTLVGYSGGGVVALLIAARLSAARLSAARLSAARLSAARLNANDVAPRRVFLYPCKNNRLAVASCGRRDHTVTQ
jgi:hypothetical protein